MNEQTVKYALQEAQDLADRFPDLSVADVIEHVEFVLGIQINIKSILAYAIVKAYTGDIILAKAALA